MTVPTQHPDGQAHAIDPICGKTVGMGTSSLESVYKGRTYFFCSVGCQTVFDAFPASSVTENSSRAPVESRDGDDDRANRSSSRGSGTNGDSDRD